MRLAAAALLVPTVLWACGCGTDSTPAEPGITCNDGYVAHPSYTKDRDGCGPHGGAVDPFTDALDAYIDDLPDGSPTAYLCHDGWRSTAVGDQGACSSHGGVARTVYPDGTQVVVDGEHAGTVINTDGTTVAPFDPNR